MHCIIKAMPELNLKYKAKAPATTTPNTEEVDTGPLEPEAKMDAIEPADMNHMRKYLNLPDPFETIQVRVQKFLGRIGGFARLLVSEVDLEQVPGMGGLAWDPVDRVKFTLLFRQDKPDIWLDSLLSRMVEIALSSSDRRMKVTACELLQAVCLLMLGNAAKGPIRRRDEESQSVHLDKIYNGFSQLYCALLQMLKWEFCHADCFSEFMRSSGRHAPPEADNFVNVTSMLRLVYNRMDHPNPYHRLGAAMAAYRLYPVLRENGGIMDRHIFEILFFCIMSLRLGELDDEQTGAMKQMSKTVDALQN